MLDHGPILVPLDGSEPSERALPYASALSAALRTHLVLLTVWEGAEAGLAETNPAMATGIAQAAQTHFTTYLDGIRARLKEPDIRTVVVPGDAADEIAAAAREIGARMIVLATHGRSGVSRWIYGSTAGRVLRESAMPVLAVGPHVPERPDGTPVKHIMAPLDGSALSEQALPVAQKFAATLNARISLARVVRWAAQSYPYSLPDAYVPHMDADLEAGAKAYLRRQEEAIKTSGHADVDAFVVRGAVADGLIDLVEKQRVDLVVMTTHARRGLARAALGSTADRLLQSRAPVLLVRPEDN